MQRLPEIERLLEIALAGGREILSVRGSDFGVIYKADRSPTTEADFRCERLVVAELASSFPDIPIVAEESDQAREADLTRNFFLVDPLDGTKEFMGGSNDFTVNIAFIEYGAPTIGVIYAPALGMIWAGSARRGAMEMKVENGQLTSVRTIQVRRMPTHLTALSSRSHSSTETLSWLKRFDVGEVISRGSSIKFCLLANGSADLYPRFGRTMEWDTGAGDAILRAAGGMVATMSGGNLTYGKCGRFNKFDFENPGFIAVGDQRLKGMVST